MPALKFVMNTASFLGATIQSFLATIFMGSGTPSPLIVSSGKTQVDWVPGTDSIMTGTGTNLKIDGSDFKKGFLKDVEYTGVPFNPFSMQLFRLNIKATKLQSTIDTIRADQIAGGETNSWTFQEFESRLFDDRKMIVIGNSNSNFIKGGNKDDTLRGNGGNDTFLGTLGNDKIFGGSGIDRLTYQTTAGVGDIVADLGTKLVALGDGSVQNISKIQKIATGEGNDTLTGNNSDNTLEGSGGNDVISGKGGNDVLNGGVGEDTILGNGGNDFIRGGENKDDITGGAGDDEIFGDGGNDHIEGGTGNDFISGGSNKDTVLGQDGKDRIFGDGGNDKLFGGNQNDYIEGGGGNDIIRGGNNRDRLKGDAGIDDIHGDAGNDTIFGGADDDILYGGAGKDTLIGGTGDDTLDGGAGKDTIFGGAGDDWINGDTGDDIFTGGAGADTFVFVAGTLLGNDTIIDFSAGDLIDITFANKDNVTLVPGDDAIVLHPYGSILLKNIDFSTLELTEIGNALTIEIA